MYTVYIYNIIHVHMTDSIHASVHRTTCRTSIQLVRSQQPYFETENSSKANDIKAAIILH